MRIRWWTDFAEFETYCKNLKPIGFDNSKETTTKAYRPYQSPAARIDTEMRSYHVAQQDEQSRSSKAKLFKTQHTTTPTKNKHRVYVLRAADGSAQSLVGYVVDPNHRLR